MTIMQNTKIEKYFIAIFLFSLFLLVTCSTAYAELSSSGILDDVYFKYTEETAKWQSEIEKAATWLFLSLVTISMVWTFSQLLFHRSSFAEFFGELIRFIMFSGTYLWFLQNGAEMATHILNSFIMLAGKASGESFVSPSSIVDIGFQITDKAWSNIDLFDNFGASLLCGIIAFIILVLLALIAINLLLQLCSVWVLAYAGIIFLGFGGSKWTSDMATNYFKTVIGVGASLMTMILLVGIGKTIIYEYFSQMSQQNNMHEMAIMFVASLTLFFLVEKLPAMVSGIVTGASIGQAVSTGSFGAGAATGAIMTGGSMGLGTAGGVSRATGLTAAAGMAKGGVKSVAKAGAQSLASAAFRRVGGK